MSLAIFNSVNPILIASGRTWAVSIGVLASVGTNVALDAALVPIFGIVGAAMSTLAAYSVSALATLFIARAALGLRVISYPLFLLPVGSAYLILKAVEGVGGIVLTVIVTLVWSVILVRVFSLFIRPDLGRLSGVRRTALH
jgi:O-antigen/teichoic acid export membrane protein